MGDGWAKGMQDKADLIDGKIDPAQVPPLPTVTTANLTSAGHAVNTAGKAVGKPVFNTTTSRPVYATGATPTSTWVDATGTLAHTPA